MGKKPKAPKPVKPPEPIAPVTVEDSTASSAGDDERRRLAAQKGRKQSITSLGGRIAEFGASILG
tara:strand:- start:543 stop:737 length:195 start_codon:yes stop_codon:yes gene_type:complete